MARFESGQREGAVEACLQALKSYPENATLHNLAGKLMTHAGQFERGVEELEIATALPDAKTEYHLDLGLILTARNRPEDAESHCRAYLAVEPDDVRALSALAAACEAQKKWREAEISWRHIIELSPHDREQRGVHNNNLAIVLRKMGRLEEAAALLRTILKDNPSHPELRYNLGNALRDMGEIDEAMEQYHLVLDSNPAHVEAHVHLGFCYLAKGNFKRGWREYEHRWKAPAFQAGRLDTPRWKGEQVDGTILLLCEQGLGDSVQFIRYAAEVAARCTKAVAYAPSSLTRLLASTPGVSDVVDWNHHVPDHDVHIPLMSLPYVFKTELDTIPAPIPYVNASTEDIAAWAHVLKDLPGPKIGIVWQGNPGNVRDHLRSISTDDMLALVRDNTAASFVCMSKERPTDIEDWPDNLYHFGERLTDVADTAALVENLDLVISIDTLLCHLAGALGKEEWILLGPSAEWRFLRERNDSPWYPGARLIRRDEHEDWPAFMERVSHDLKARF